MSISVHNLINIFLPQRVKISKERKFIDLKFLNLDRSEEENWGWDYLQEHAKLKNASGLNLKLQCRRWFRVKVKHFSVENEIYVEFPLLKAVLSRWAAASEVKETRNSENCLSLECCDYTAKEVAIIVAL